MISTERSMGMNRDRDRARPQAPPRPVLTPGASRKRKERDDLRTLKASTTISLPTRKADPAQDPAPSSSNRLLAGYLAHEFLTKGTLFGEKWDPSSPAKEVAVTAETKKVVVDKVAEDKEVGKESAAAAAAAAAGKNQSYVAVANLMKAEGTHIPGIVNPTQLARWIQM